MNKTLLLVIAVISFLASISMYLIGDNSSHLSELKDFFWTPIPLGILALIRALRNPT
ncbi:MAG: hypothetical protein O9264_04470 [Leptospira sp.]|nr:hypothetical protein [Leptospira sp.]